MPLVEEASTASDHSPISYLWHGHGSLCVCLQRTKYAFKTIILNGDWVMYAHCLLFNNNIYLFQEYVPSRSDKDLLTQGGLGEKKITFPKSHDAAVFKQTLEAQFPQLAKCGGYFLLRQGFQSKGELAVIRPPAEGYNSTYLSDRAGLGQAIVYARPAQKDIPLSTKDAVEVWCKDYIHFNMCCSFMIWLLPWLKVIF